MSRKLKNYSEFVFPSLIFWRILAHSAHIMKKPYWQYGIVQIGILIEIFMKKPYWQYGIVQIGILIEILKETALWTNYDT